MKLIESKYFLFYQRYHSIKEIIELLERAPIIPNFNKTKDEKKIKNIDKKFNNKKIILSNHRLHWVAKK